MNYTCGTPLTPILSPPEAKSVYTHGLAKDCQIQSTISKFTGNKCARGVGGLTPFRVVSPFVFDIFRTLSIFKVRVRRDKCVADNWPTFTDGQINVVPHCIQRVVDRRWIPAFQNLSVQVLDSCGATMGNTYIFRFQSEPMNRCELSLFHLICGYVGILTHTRPTRVVWSWGDFIACKHNIAIEWQ